MGSQSLSKWITVNWIYNNSSTKSLVSFNQNTAELYIGRSESSTYSLDGYIAEVVIIDGQQLMHQLLLQKKKMVCGFQKTLVGTFGNNGAYLKFENASDLGNDSSGNNNDFSTNGYRPSSS